ncbi:MAG TPA: DUF4136 domain-containing protein [Polyangiaceae bacterium]|nr:DUF4136 domain-containing protein [Polyangiaceae bacterium]
MTSKLYAVGLSACLLLGGIGCSQEDVVVRTAAGEQANVARFSTFGIILPTPEELEQNEMKPENAEALAKLALEEMERRGYQPVAPDTADLLIVFGAQVTKYGPTKAEDTSLGADSKYTDTRHAEGKLTISFVDAKAKSIVYQRVAETRLLVGGPSEPKMKEGMAQVFAEVPNAPGGAATAPATQTATAEEVAPTPETPAPATPEAAPAPAPGVAPPPAPAPKQ